MNIKDKIKQALSKNMVLVLFVVICVFEISVAHQPASYIIGEIMTRIFRNAVLILSLLVPVWAGLGLNFSIVIGAMAAEIGLIITKNFYIGGVSGLLLSFAISIPLATLFGYLTGKLFNRTKGQEMITGMILGFFAKGLFDLVFMFLCGPVIPVKNKDLLLTNGIGLITPIVLDEKTSGAFNKLWKMPLDRFGLIVLVIASAFMVARYVADRKKGKAASGIAGFKKPLILLAVTGIYLLLLAASPQFRFALSFSDVPLFTGLLILLVCLFIVYLGKTKLGSDMQAVGQSNEVASSMGIDVNKIRITAVVISTIIASLGQIIYIQEIGNFATYNAHENVSTFSIAALLVGGASIKKATIGQVFLGALLFHTMFVISPIAGRELFGSAQMGEYFRVLACYAVITIALVMHSVSENREEE